MIRAPRDLVRKCAAELASTPRWKRRPFTSLKNLIYGLNTISAEVPNVKYRHGLPRPSVTMRELEGIRGLCRQSKNGRDCSAVVARLHLLIERDADSYRLLLFQAALITDPDRPERAVVDGRALQTLQEVARNQPRCLAQLAKQAQHVVRGHAKQGRGGSRTRGPHGKQELIWRLAILFEDITGKQPSVVFNHHTENSELRYSGSFVRFVTAVFGALDLPVTGRQISDHLAAIRRAERTPLSASNIL